MDVHHIARMPGVKVIHPWQQPLRAEGRQHGQMQRAAFGLVRDGLQGCTADAAQCGSQLMLIQRACGGQLDASAITLEQFDFQLRLQRLHLPADGALGQGQFVCGLGEAAMPRSRLEGEQQRHGGRQSSGVHS